MPKRPVELAVFFFGHGRHGGVGYGMISAYLTTVCIIVIYILKVRIFSLFNFFLFNDRSLNRTCLGTHRHIKRCRAAGRESGFEISSAHRYTFQK